MKEEPKIEQPTAESEQSKPPPKDELRQFSKEHSSEERQQIAAEIRNKRQEYFGKKETLSEQIQTLALETREKDKKVSDAVKEVKEIEAIFLERKASKINQLLRYFEIKKLQKEVGKKAFTADQFRQEYQEVQDFLQTLRQQQEDRRELEEAKNILRNFYHGQEEKWNAYEEDKKNRDVANIAEEHKVVFVHGVHPHPYPSGGSLLKPGVDWQTKLNILLALEPAPHAIDIHFVLCYT